MSNSECPRVTTNSTTNVNKWQRVVQQVTTNTASDNENEWYNEWKRVTMYDHRYITSQNTLFPQKMQNTL